uniref:Uncharacterized protein n=1 Tax=Minutocellus polymorphus TaxID=265543 RepID=A0A7S0AKQ2_9STRA|mmetsp:Transcript_15921/g.26516  ORF Transcript_15921/g.26516 Transcript_15921/m.26516 type:complete len:390 (+) Transcript_15921:43-1212(+)
MKVFSMSSMPSLPSSAPRSGSAALFAAAASASAYGLVCNVSADAVDSDERGAKQCHFDGVRNMAVVPVLVYRYQPALCEAKVGQQVSSAPRPTSSPPSVASRGRRFLNYLGIANLPVPRLLTPSDPIFSYPEMKAGIRQRARDEAKLRSLQTEAIQARTSGDTQRINAVFEKISSIAYGVGVKPQDREDFLVKYGCTGWTDDMITHLLRLGKDRGFVEVGAGNGQWAREIQDKYKEQCASGDIILANRTKNFEFILPYDDMSELPLSPQVYHRHTAPVREHFHGNVQKSSHAEAIRSKWETRGRVLLLVYPPPGPMAIESVQAYTDVYPEGNDTVVYVGEGRGGANANDEFFDFFCSDGAWVVENVMDANPSPGGKGYEKCFVLRRVKK